MFFWAGEKIIFNFIGWWFRVDLVREWAKEFKRRACKMFRVDESKRGGIFTHWPKTSATLLASSGLNLTLVPFSAWSLNNSLIDLFSVLSGFGDIGRPGVWSWLPSAGNNTEFRGVVVEVMEFISNEERSQSSWDDEEDRESWDRERSLPSLGIGEEEADMLGNDDEEMKSLGWIDRKV